MFPCAHAPMQATEKAMLEEDIDAILARAEVVDTTREHVSPGLPLFIYISNM